MRFLVRIMDGYIPLPTEENREDCRNGHDGWRRRNFPDCPSVADRRSLFAAEVILLVLSPFVFILGVPFATGSGPEYLPTDPKLAQQAREARDAELGLD